MTPLTRISRVLRCWWHALPLHPFSSRLAYLARQAPRYQAGRIRFNGFDVQYTDRLSFYIEYKDIFLNRIYHFDTKSPAPCIIDGGGHIGMSVLYFKSVYPNARIVCFEPDPTIFQILQQNVKVNHLTNVELVQAGLAREAGTARFLPDRADGSGIVNGQNGSVTIQAVRLSDYLTVPVDFLKLNIEGQELPVLEEAEASGKLHNVQQLVLEYHGWASGEQRLGPILDLLDRQGFRYLIHDFDAETCGASKPPFRLTLGTTWFCLVYARRLDD